MKKGALGIPHGAACQKEFFLFAKKNAATRSADALVRPPRGKFPRVFPILKDGIPSELSLKKPLTFTEMNRLLIAILAAATLGTAAWAVLRARAVAAKPGEVKACCQRPPSRAALLQGK